MKKCKIKAPKYAFGAKEIGDMLLAGGNLAQGINGGNQTAQAVFNGIDSTLGNIPVIGKFAKIASGLGKIGTAIAGTKGSVDEVTGDITRGSGILGRRNRHNLEQQSGIVKNNIAAALNSARYAADWYSENGYNGLSYVANGGIIPNTLAYLDDGEYGWTPDGVEFKVPEQGKPKDSNLVSVPVGTAILSDVKGPNGSKDSYAKLYEKNKAKTNMRGNDIYALNSKMLNERHNKSLREDYLAMQESDKKSKSKPGKYARGTSGVEDKKLKKNVGKSIFVPKPDEKPLPSIDRYVDPTGSLISDQTMPNIGLTANITKNGMPFDANVLNRKLSEEPLPKMERYKDPIGSIIGDLAMPAIGLIENSSKNEIPINTNVPKPKWYNRVSRPLLQKAMEPYRPEWYWWDKGNNPAENPIWVNDVNRNYTGAADNGFYSFRDLGNDIVRLSKQGEMAKSVKNALQEPPTWKEAVAGKTGNWTLDYVPEWLKNDSVPKFSFSLTPQKNNSFAVGTELQPSQNAKELVTQQTNKTQSGTTRKTNRINRVKTNLSIDLSVVLNAEEPRNSFKKFGRLDENKMVIPNGINSPIKNRPYGNLGANGLESTPSQTKNNKWSWLGDVAGATAGLIGPLMNITAKRGESNVPYTYTPKYGPTDYNINPLLRSIDDTYSMANYNMANLNPNTGANMAFGLQAAINRDKQMANAYATKNNQENNMAMQNAGIYNNWGQFNANAQHTAAVENAQDLAAVNLARRQGWSDFSTALQTMNKDKRLMQRDALVANAFAPFFDYGMSPEFMSEFNKLRKRYNYVG